MSEKRLPLPESEFASLIKDVPTPFHLYDEKAFTENAEAFYDAFSWAPGFTNFFAVKACPNPAILRRLASLGFGADCSSLPELLLSKASGISGEKIVFTSNDTPAEEFRAAYEMGAIINLDDITHIDFLHDALGGAFPELICFRYNPGPDRTGNAIIGNPVEAKYGVTKDQLIECYRRAKALGAKRFGLHTMVASNELNAAYIVETARMLFSLVRKIKDELDIDIEFIDMGGGVGIPYRPEDEGIDLYALSSELKKLYEEYGMKVRLTFECGRMIMGPYGYLVTRALHVTKKYKDYVGVDACMADLMRPALYGSYHHITVPGKSALPHDHVYDVTGSLCENNDKFAIDRALPEIEEGDILVIHETGA
ncbi:MAG: diaminopimelate decarboxylase, partial [Bullifex sp.]